MHGFDSNTPVEETLRTLDDLVQSGNVRFIAASNFSGWHMMKSLAISEKYGWILYVIKDIDLTGKIAVITDGHSGLGLESTHALQKAGAHVIVGSQDTAAAHKTLADIKNIEIASLDLADINSVNNSRPPSPRP